MLPAQLEEDFVKANQEWVKELEIMVATKARAFSGSLTAQLASMCALAVTHLQWLVPG